MTPMPQTAIAWPCRSRRIDVEQHRLRQRHQRRAAHALQQAEEHHLRRGSSATPHSAEATVKPATEIEEHALDAEAAGEPAGQRRHDRRGDDVGGQHPGDLVLRRRQAALHVRQRDIGDRRVERLHDRRQHDRDRDERRGSRPGARRRRCRTRRSLRGARAARAEQGLRSPRAMGWRWPVSTSTVTLSPARSGSSGSGLSSSRRTGRRCTTLTQLPVAFCGGSTREGRAGARAEAGDARLERRAGIGVDRRPSRCLARPHMRELGLLEVGLDPGRSVGTSENTGVAALR